MRYNGPVSVSTSVSKVDIPYSCRCAWCGSHISGTDEIKAYGHVFKPGYFTENEKTTAAFSSGYRSSQRMRVELEYAEKRLEHYRETVRQGRLQEYLRTGHPRKEDWFRVEKGSYLDIHLRSANEKTKDEYEQDKKRLKVFPYVWKQFDKDNTVKCPDCGKIQPWCYDTACQNAKFWVILSMFAVSQIMFWPAFFSKTILGWPLAAKLPYLAGSVALPILIGILLFCLVRKLIVSKYAKMPWNADDLPVYDAEYISEFRRLNWPEPGEKAGK